MIVPVLPTAASALVPYELSYDNRICHTVELLKYISMKIGSVKLKIIFPDSRSSNLSVMFSYIPSVYLINILPLVIIEKCILNCNRRFHEISPVSQSISRLFDGIFDTQILSLYNSLYRKNYHFQEALI